MDKSKLFFYIFCFSLVFIGLWRYQIIKLELESSELNREGEVVLIGVIVKEPDVRETNVKLTLKLINKNGRDRISAISGKILVTVNKYPEYRYGDELKIKGKLQTPIVFDDFNYRGYLFNQGIVSVIYYPQVEVLAKGQTLYSKILDFKDRLRQVIYGSLSPPQSSILGAMILGDKNRMSFELKEKLNVAGVRHITAVSGMHILILSSILMSLLLGLGFWRNHAFAISLVIVFLFIAITGFQPSGIRAGIMGGLLILSQMLGRRSLSYRAVFLAGVLMFAINPFLIKDAGFQLSFLAVIGIISLFPSLRKLVKVDVIAITLAAYIFTLPILIYNFGQISLVGVLTNVLIVPVIYWIMILGLAFVFIGLLWSGLALVLSFPVWLLLTYVIKVVEVFSDSWATKTIDNVHWVWLINSYLFLIVLVLYLKRREY